MFNGEFSIIYLFFIRTITVQTINACYNAVDCVLQVLFEELDDEINVRQTVTERFGKK